MRPGRVALETSARTLRELGRLGADLLPLPGRLPRRAADLDPAALTALLGRRVTEVTLLGGTSGTTDRSVLGLSGEDVPASVFVKVAATDRGTRLFGGLARLGEVEVGFYDAIRPGLELEAPRLLGSRFDRRTGRFVIVLEDLAARGAGFADTRTPLSREQAEAVIDTLARLHGSTYGIRQWPAWLGTNAGDALMPLVQASLGPLGRRVAVRDPELCPAGGAALLASYRRWAPLLEQGTHCVLHGDPHPGNVYLLDDAGATRAGLLDWQAVRRGDGVRDVSYLLVLGLTVEDRRAWERDLLTYYADRLAAAGGPALPVDDLLSRHRRMVGYAFVSATFTSGLGGLQGDDIAETGLRRAVAAVEDLDTVAALTV